MRRTTCCIYCGATLDVVENPQIPSGEVGLTDDFLVPPHLFEEEMCEGGGKIPDFVSFDDSPEIISIPPEKMAG